MKRRLFILPILAGFVLSGCSFQDLMFWKKKTDDTQQKEEKEDKDQPSGDQTPSGGDQGGDQGGGGGTPAATDWSETVKADMKAHLYGEVVPFISSGTWTWEYDDEYDCYSGSSSNASLASTKDVFNGKNGFTFVQNDEYGDPYYAKSTPTPENSNYELWVNVYTYSSKTWVDCYLYPVQNLEWPTEALASCLQEAGLEVNVPKYENNQFVYYVATYTDEDVGKYVELTILDTAETDAELVYSLDDYCDILEEAGFIFCGDNDNVVYTNEGRTADLTIQDYEGSGLLIYITPHTFDYSILLYNYYALLAVGDESQIYAEVGQDYTAQDSLAFESKDTSVATVDANGTVTAVGAGSTKIVVDGGHEETAELTVYVETTLPTAFSAEDAEELDKLVNGLAASLPYDPHFEKVQYHAETEQNDEYLEVLGYEKYVADYMNFEEYCQALEDCNWVDISEEYGVSQHLAYGFDEDAAAAATTLEEYFAAMYIYSYAVYSTKIGDHYYDVAMYLIDENGKESIEGTFLLEIYDPYAYDFADVNEMIHDYLDYVGIASFPLMPEISGDHYMAMSDETGLYIYAYNSETTCTDYKTALEAATFHVDEVSEEEDGVNYIYYVATYSMKVDEKDVTVTFAFEKEGTTFMLGLVGVSGLGGFAESEDDLYDGAEIAIFSTSCYGLGAYTNNKYFAAVDALDESDEIDTETEGLLHLFLEEAEDGWYLKDGEGNYYGSNSNKDIKVGENADSLEWDISFDDEGVATMSCCTWDLLFNSNSGQERFKTYASSFEQGVSLLIYIY